MKKINFSSTENHLSKNLFSFGSIACKIVKNSRKNDETIYKFLNKAITVYSNCAAYMVKELLLNNDFLKTVAEIDLMGNLAKSTVTLKAILYLLEMSQMFCHQQTKMKIMKRSAEKLWLIQLYYKQLLIKNFWELVPGGLNLNTIISSDE